MLIMMLALTGCENNPFTLNPVEVEVVMPTTLPIDMITIYADDDDDGYGRSDVNREIVLETWEVTDDEGVSHLVRMPAPNGWSYEPGDCDDGNAFVTNHTAVLDTDGDGFAECTSFDTDGNCEDDDKYVCSDDDLPEGYIFLEDADSESWDMCEDEPGDVEGCAYKRLSLVCKGEVKDQAGNAIRDITGRRHGDRYTVVMNIASTDSDDITTVWTEELDTSFACKQVEDEDGELTGPFVAIGTDGLPVDANCYLGSLGYPVHDAIDCSNIATLSCDNQPEVRDAKIGDEDAEVDACETFSLDTIGLSYVDEPVEDSDEPTTESDESPEDEPDKDESPKPEDEPSDVD